MGTVTINTKTKSEKINAIADICVHILINNIPHIYFIEVKVFDPLAPSNINISNDQLGVANHLKFDKIKPKYDEAINDFINNNSETYQRNQVHWWPLIFENTGGLHDNIIKFLEFITNHIAPDISPEYTGKAWEQNTLDTIYAYLIRANCYQFTIYQRRYIHQHLKYL